MTNFKNKHHKQVWPLFVKHIQIRQLIQLLRIALSKPAHYSRNARQALNYNYNRCLSHFPTSSLSSLPSFIRITALSLSLSLCKHLSLLVRTVFLFSNPNPNPHEINCILNGIFWQRHQAQLVHRFFCLGLEAGSTSFLAVNLLVLAAAIPAPTSGIGFNFLPPLPITTFPFKFLKGIDL